MTDFRAKQRLPKLISVKDACELLDVSSTVIRRLIFTQTIAAQLIGHSYAIGEKSVKEYQAHMAELESNEAGHN